LKSILIDEESYFFLLHLKTRYGTFKLALQSMIQENIELKSRVAFLEDKIRDFEHKLEREHDFLKQAHLAAVSRPVIMGQSQSATPYQITNAPQVNMQQKLMPPPPKLSSKAKPFIKEMNDKFKEGKLKPSEVATAEFKEVEFLPEEKE